MLFHWYQSYHWYQWRPFLSPLTPMESICKYWTTLQESLSVLRDVKSTQPHNILAHASPSLEFSSPAMVLALHQWLHEEKDESGSEFSSSTSGDSPFEIITLPASDSFHALCDYSSLPEESFSGLLEPALETSLKAVMLHRS